MVDTLHGEGQKGDRPRDRKGIQSGAAATENTPISIPVQQYCNFIVYATAMVLILWSVLSCFIFLIMILASGQHLIDR